MVASNTLPLGGLTPVKMSNGMPYDGFGRPYYIVSGGTAIGIGDLVVKQGSSNSVAVVSSGGRVMGATDAPIGSYTTVLKTADGANASTGVVVGVGMDPSKAGVGPSYASTDTASVVYVEDNPDVVFEIQSNALGGVHTNADIQQNANVVSSTPNLNNGRSTATLDSTSLGTGATKALRIIGVSEAYDRGDMTLNYPSFYVKINNHTETPNVAGI